MQTELDELRILPNSVNIIPYHRLIIYKFHDIDDFNYRAISYIFHINYNESYWVFFFYVL